MAGNPFFPMPVLRKREAEVLREAKGHGAPLSVPTLQGTEARPSLLLTGGQQHLKYILDVGRALATSTCSSPECG